MKPEINVTPLIDVLLVLLIIFMVVAPLKPSSFKARVPAEPPDISEHVEPNPETLAVEIDRNAALTLNRETGLGTASDTASLVKRLRAVFAERVANGDVSESFADDPQRPHTDRIERTVFIKAPRDLDYGSVARVVDAVKLAGAYPISLQIDKLE
ncbi:MAG: biopolymer transporter ExbD [Chloracidobacterium sp.]|nr:biopolymer transporter ExbD [Chloracidobacterium sp.]